MVAPIVRSVRQNTFHTCGSVLSTPTSAMLFSFLPTLYHIANFQAIPYFPLVSYVGSLSAFHHISLMTVLATSILTIKPSWVSILLYSDLIPYWVCPYILYYLLLMPPHYITSLPFLVSLNYYSFLTTKRK